MSQPARTLSPAPRPIHELIEDLLVNIGEDPRRDGLLKTPDRVARAYEFLTSGYRTTVDEIANDAIFESPEANEMVVVRNIEFYSLCEHHLLPFFGKVNIGYIPLGGRILGLSKFGRLTDVFARRLQVQERLTVQLAEAIQSLLDPAGVAVMIEANHLCMMMRGVEKQDSSTVTTCMLGVFREDPKTRQEFMYTIDRGS
jgi:GTP cyclohydrolase IA